MKETKLTFIADTHHFSPTLADHGRQYELRSGSDQKCLLETGSIIDAAFEKIANSDTEAVMIIGDITDNGERVCHEELREKLYKLKESKKVYLITATHDWCSDNNPRKFRGNAVYHDVPVIGHKELRDYYYDFGPGEADSEFITHLGTCSYTVDIGENVRLLALNDDQNGKGRAGFKEDHFQWIEQQIKKAEADGKILIGMEHHLLIAHVSPLLFGGSTCVGDREIVASRLADAGLKYMFVGHSHIQCIDSFTSEAGNTITEVNVGSLVGYPAPIVNVTVSDEGLKIDVETIESFNFEGKEYEAKPYLQKHATDFLDRVFEGALISKAEFAERMTAMQLDGEKLKNLYYIFKPISKRYFKATAGDVVKLLKVFGFGSCINKQAAEKFKDKKLTDFVHETFLSALDGHGKGVDDRDYLNLVMSVADCLIKVKPSKTTHEIKLALQNIITNNCFHNAVIK